MHVHGSPFELGNCNNWMDGDSSNIELVFQLALDPNNFYEVVKPIYCDDTNYPNDAAGLKESLWKKIETIAKEIYKASKITSDEKVKNDLKKFEKNGYGKLPVCIAKTQYSFSVDPKLKGAPSNHEIPIREVRLSSGAEFIVVICGSIMTMPGLPRVPAADSIKLNNKGEIEGLF